MEFMFVVQDRFAISGRGMAIVGPPGSRKRAPFFRSGQAVELRRPDGSVRFTHARLAGGREKR